MTGSLQRVWIVGLQGALAVVWLAPVLWMVSTAIKREGTILQYPIQWIPPARNLTLENFSLIVMCLFLLGSLAFLAQQLTSYH